MTIPTVSSNKSLIVSIKKNLTASGKSVYWTLNEGSKVICRVASKKTGIAIANLVNRDNTYAFGQESVQNKPHAKFITYLTHNGQRIGLTTDKAFYQLDCYLYNPERKLNLITLQASNAGQILILNNPYVTKTQFIEILANYVRQLKSRVTRGEELRGSVERGVSERIIGLANFERQLLETGIGLANIQLGQRDQLGLALDQRKVRDHIRSLDTDGDELFPKQFTASLAALEGKQFSGLTLEFSRKVIKGLIQYLQY